MYICPRCQEDLTTITLEGLELEKCTGCEGMWFDASELNSFIDGAQTPEPSDIEAISDNQQQTGVQSKETALDCPKCDGVKLIAFEYDGDTGIELDSCPSCHGLWLDKNESKQIEFFANMNKESKFAKLQANSAESNRIKTEKEREQATADEFKRMLRRHRYGGNKNPFSIF